MLGASLRASSNAPVSVNSQQHVPPGCYKQNATVWLHSEAHLRALPRYLSAAQGMSSATAEVMADTSKMVRLWVHEVRLARAGVEHMQKEWQLNLSHIPITWSLAACCYVCRAARHVPFQLIALGCGYNKACVWIFPRRSRNCVPSSWSSQPLRVFHGRVSYITVRDVVAPSPPPLTFCSPRCSACFTIDWSTTATAPGCVTWLCHASQSASE